MEQLRFAIIFVGRQGSTYLEDLLDSHPDISCRGEIFAPCVFKRSGAEAVEAQLVTQVHALPARIVGFKLSLQDVMNHPEILGIVKKHRYKAIRLARNLLDQFLSMEPAIANDAWTSDARGRGITQIKTTSVKLEDLFRVHHYGNTILRESTETMQALDISYEESVRKESHDLILRFLGAKISPLQSAARRQRSGGQRQSLENYDEMKTFFAGSRWANEFLE